jgi:hypothetical protein
MHPKANHIDIYYNKAHPGVHDPRYHIALWSFSREQAAALQ